VSGSVTQKGEAVSGDVKVNATIVDQIIDLELNQDAKAKVTASFPSVIPNGKLSVGGTVQDLESFKVSASLVAGALGLKADVANYAAPRADASVCYALGGGVAVGAMATVKSSAVAYAVAAQSKQGDVTYALTAADQFKTFKVSAVTALDNKQTIGAEVTYKKTATATIGYSKKMDGHSFKAVVSNPVAAEVNPTLCVNASLGNLIPKTTATLSAQVDKTVRTQTKSERERERFERARLVSSRLDPAALVKQSPRPSWSDDCRESPTSTMLEDGARASPCVMRHK
jgi:hypothetical protein